MIFIKEKDFLLKTPTEVTTKDISNILVKDLEIGHCIFVMPNIFDGFDKPKNIKNAYKVGFLFDLLTEIYPTYDKTAKYNIISDKYHFSFTYRQFKNILDEYELYKTKIDKKLVDGLNIEWQFKIIEALDTVDKAGPQIEACIEKIKGILVATFS